MRSLFLLFTCVLMSFAASAADKPNIVIIYADDIGYGDFSCYGGTGVDTPYVDQLASNGLRFTSAYATASTCTPSRFSLLTGKYAFRNENAVILPGNAPLIIDPSKPTLASMLKDSGYATALVGKWHLGLGVPTESLNWNGTIAPGPKEVGFEYSYHMAATGDRVPSVYIENGHIVNLDKNDPVAVSYGKPIGDEPTSFTHPEMLKIQADKQHGETIVNGISRIGTMTGGQSARWTDEEISDEFLKKALGFIEDKQDEPFFLYYATHENHVPRVPHPRFQGSSSLGLRGDAIAQFDWNVGQIVKKLAELGLRENTLIILSSDNGPVLFDGYWDAAIEKNGDHRAAGPFFGGKYSSNEGGTRMPFIASWPGTIEPGLSDALVSQVDILSSVASLIGYDLSDENLDSVDLMDTLLGDSEKGRQSLVQQGMSNKAFRSGDWKYIPPSVNTNRGGINQWNRVKIDEPGALFYLPEDPEERNNLSLQYPDVVERLRKEMDDVLGEDGRRVSSKDSSGGAIVE